MFKQHTKCRACGSGLLAKVFSLGNQPLANDFKTIDEDREGLAPLEILSCQQCNLAQLSVVVDPNLIYSHNYPYVTSNSLTMQQHFASLLGAIRAEADPKSVLEIGSNDGRFLKFLKDNGSGFVLGIDPADNLVKAACGRGINTIHGLFDQSVAREALGRAGYFDLVIARHVFGHVDNWKEFVKNLELVSSPETLFVIEVPYIMDFLRDSQFDTCYHEHLSYVSINSMVELLKDTGLYLHKVVRFPIHGGAIAMMLRRRDSERSPHWTVREMIDSEMISQFTWDKFEKDARRKIHDLREAVRHLSLSGKTVCGFGASAKSTVMVQACGFDRSQIGFICDSTPNKQGRLSPNTDIPIVCEAELLVKMPDYAVIFCWNFAAEVVSRNQEYLNRGGHFIIPIPELKII